MLRVCYPDRAGLSGLAAGVKLAELRHNPIDGELAEE
jgi:hypothetical protein